MTEHSQEKSLTIDEDMQFQEREWQVERASWWLGLLLLIAAVLGLFGAGPLSQRAVQSGNFQVQYALFGRYQLPVELKVRVQPGSTAEQGLEVWMSRSYLERHTINGILPEPVQVRESANRIVFVFDTDTNGEPLEFVFRLQAETIGLHSAQVGLVSSDEWVEFRSFTYP